MPSPSFVDAYRARFAEPRNADPKAADIRFVALDSETTGLDPRKDRLVTIGAVAVREGEIRLDDTFEALLKVAHNTSSVTVHGVTRDEGRGGLDEPVALEQLLVYLDDAVIVGHHVLHDVETLNTGYERHFGLRLLNTVVDTMDLTLHLERDGAFPGRESFSSFSLDALCAAFGVVPHDRHTAAGDAFLTARVFQRLYRLAARGGRDRLVRLAEAFPVDEPTQA